MKVYYFNRCLIILCFLFSGSLFAQKTDDNSNKMDEIIVKPSKETYFSSFKNKSLLSVEAVHYSSKFVKELNYFPWSCGFKVVNTIDDSIEAEMICIKTDKNFKPDEVKIIYY